MRQYLVEISKSIKLNSFNPYIEEFTVFIKVKIDNLNELSKLIPLIVKKLLKKSNEMTNITIERKYL
jgi:hypothetical protein